MTTRTVVTLATIPSRSAYIIPALESLLAQAPDKIYVWAVLAMKRTQEKGYIPENLRQYCQEHDKIHLEQVEDYGPITKLLPILEHERDLQTQIIVTDDDSIIRHPAWLQQLKEHVRDDRAVAYAGVNFIKDELPPRVFTVSQHLGQADVIEAYCGYIVKRGWFNDDFVNIIECLSAEWDNCLELICSDDLIVSDFLKHIGIQTSVIWTDQICKFNVIQRATYSVLDALHLRRGSDNANLLAYFACHQRFVERLNKTIPRSSRSTARFTQQ